MHARVGLLGGWRQTVRPRLARSGHYMPIEAGPSSRAHAGCLPGRARPAKAPESSETAHTSFILHGAEFAVMDNHRAGETQDVCGSLG